MLYKIFQFEILYRARRIETYVFFTVVFLFSLVAVNFILDGQDLGGVKENAPLVTAKVMSIISGIFMLICSMIMGVPIIRDFEHQMESFIFVNPISKRDYLMGRFLGSFVILVFIFSAVLWGVILGEYMPWRSDEELASLPFYYYLIPFLSHVLPNLFLGSCLFFVGGMLSRKIIVVYCQGLVFFMVSILSQNIENEVFASILEPFSYAAIDLVVDSWTLEMRNSRLLPITGYLLLNRLFWILVGVIVLFRGYYLFTYNVVKEEKRKKADKKRLVKSEVQVFDMPNLEFTYGKRKKYLDSIFQSLFYFNSIIKTPSFWAIVGCGVVTIFINSINLGTVHQVNSLPLSYLILEELKEMSLYFFVIIMIFYPGELIWKERQLRIDGLMDSLPTLDFSVLAGKFLGLNLVYLVLLSVLILAGISFQTFSAYFHYDLKVYFIGMFIEVWSFLILFTVLTFFLQVFTNAKFIAHILVVLCFVVIMFLGLSGWRHGLYAFGGIAMPEYSEMNGYGHFLGPFLWFKMYWLFFGVLLFIVTVGLRVRGMKGSLISRLRILRQKIDPPLRKTAYASLGIFVLLGGYIFWNTNVINEFHFGQSQLEYRAAYEKHLKQFEYQVQPKIVDVDLAVDLFPSEQSYIVEGCYILANNEEDEINQIHVQKALSSDEKITYLKFSSEGRIDSTYEKYGYFIYHLEDPLKQGGGIKMDFKQSAISRGFQEDNDATHIVKNGTFFDNDRFPSLGYNNDYELDDEIDRKRNGLGVQEDIAKRNDTLELKNGRDGDDGSKIDFEIILSTEFGQTGIAPGYLEDSWVEEGRIFFHYKMHKPMINFYSIMSATYEVLNDEVCLNDVEGDRIIDLEVYYHLGHDRNIFSMMDGVKASLIYYNEHFTAFPYDQLRIIEFPRYAQFAQSFPTTIPFSESIGFVLDVKEKDVNIPFYITAHKVAHQWWGLHLVAANVEGRNMIVETLAQYSALMVLKKVYGDDKVLQYLEGEKDLYHRGRTSNLGEERPLARVGGERHLYYSKGALNMYAFQDCISEDLVNLALKRFLLDWNNVDGKQHLKYKRYPTTEDLLNYFEEVTPVGNTNLIKELFEQ